jgi:hypothetical protein
VVPVDLEQVDVLRFQPGEGIRDGREDGGAREAVRVDVVPGGGEVLRVWRGDRGGGGDEPVTLCEDEDLVAGDVILYQARVR